ncbi:hypothetical protein F0L74_10480 [Chitinophaga agrisoli]|uniref:Uncharacterized protein n=1 Tax=Chitinophaga agrisoli TaxID=2607653 RepID=A0A5B2VX95_9BACT|nr:hypothetical protein [Chitinophaga agrisoli]KAA2242942.1 hypothetical protein F0L74_10480 [Chitinophaga agrisoli]
MKRRNILSVGLMLSLSACNMTTPEEYFDRTVLNANLISHFGGKEIYDMLQGDPQSYDEKSKKMVPSSYVDQVKWRIGSTEKAYKDILEMKETEETKAMLEASKDLFSFAVDKEKNGYLSIAAMKDAHAPDDSIKQAVSNFDQQYQDTFGQKYDKLMELGKAYADKNHLKVGFTKF